MTIRRASATLILLAFCAAASADTPPATTPAQPKAPVSATDPTPAPTTAAPKPTADAAKATAPKPVPDAKAGDKSKDGDFKPSEQVSEDMAVAYPVDI
jgi:hypothetical protein